MAQGYPHHITQRGNYRQKIFSSDTDREKYLSLTDTESKRYGLKILAYCLMPNHVHFIAVPENDDSMKMVKTPCGWKWSSAKAHCGIDERDTFGVRALFDYADYPQKNWKKFIEEPDDAEEIQRIRSQTRRGRPLGENQFIRKLEKKLNSFLALKPRGRPKKQIK